MALNAWDALSERQAADKRLADEYRALSLKITVLDFGTAREGLQRGPYVDLQCEAMVGDTPKHAAPQVVRLFVQDTFTIKGPSDVK